MNLSLRTRLLLGVIVSSVLLLGILCAILYAITRNTLLAQFDNSLLSTARMLSAVVEKENYEEEHYAEKNKASENHSGSKLDFEFDVRMTPEFNNLNGGGYYQFWNHDKTLIVRSPSLGKANLPYFGEESSTDTYRQCLLPDDKPGRAVSYRFIPRTKEEIHTQDDHFIIVVARDSSQLYDFLGFFRWLLINCSLAIIVLSGFVAAKVTRIGLQPVYTLADEIESVDEKALEQSFSTETYPVELVPICKCLNDLLERIKNSFQRERRFNADVAHELRTPLAGIRSVLEVTSTRTRETEEYKTAISECLEISKRMQSIVNNLLILARMDGGQVALRCETIGLKKFIDSIRQSFTPNVLDKNITFENSVPGTLTVKSDPDQLHIIISNLIDNAVEYTNNSGNIRITARQSESLTKIAFTNTGCQLTEEQLLQIFDCFWRGDLSRTDTGIHCGLGLALVQKIIKILGGICSAKTNEDGLFVLELSLP